MRVGGGLFWSDDKGVTWGFSDFATTIDGADDQPWINTVNVAYMTAGQIRWEAHGSINRWVIAYGLGIMHFNNPPRTAPTQKYISATTGINQMLMMSAHRASNGDLWMAAQDKPVWKFPAGQWEKVVARSYPDNNYALRMGCDVDTAPEDPNFAVAVWMSGGAGSGTLKYTENGGNTWNFPSTVPTFVHAGSGQTLNFTGGEICVLSKTNWIWVSTNGGAVAVTKDKGATWQTPVFKHSVGGASVDMSNAYWSHAYYIRRKGLRKTGQADTAAVTAIGRVNRTTNPGQVPFDGNAEDLAIRGEWRTTDGGSTFIRIRASAFFSDPVSAFYTFNKHYSFANPNHMLVCAGNHDGPQRPNGGCYPSDWSLYCSTDQGATGIEMTGFREVESADFGAPRNAGGSPTVYLRGWKGSNMTTAVYGIYASENFDISDPNAATWTLVDTFPFGRPDEGSIMLADPANFGRLVFVIPSGNYVVRDYRWAAKAA